jgi:hypothetical protein
MSVHTDVYYSCPHFEKYFVDKDKCGKKQKYRLSEGRMGTIRSWSIDFAGIPFPIRVAHFS